MSKLGHVQQAVVHLSAILTLVALVLVEQSDARIPYHRFLGLGKFMSPAAQQEELSSPLNLTQVCICGCNRQILACAFCWTHACISIFLNSALSISRCQHMLLFLSGPTAACEHVQHHHSTCTAHMP